jgi:hypothetical protein
MSASSSFILMRYGMREFIQQNSRSLTIISILIAGWGLLYFLQDKDRSEEYFAHPKMGDIYILKNGHQYAPIYLDSFSDNYFYMRNYNFLFEQAIPSEDQIMKSEFDFSLMAIYERDELLRLDSLGKLVRIYRK